MREREREREREGEREREREGGGRGKRVSLINFYVFSSWNYNKYREYYCYDFRQLFWIQIRIKTEM